GERLAVRYETANGRVEGQCLCDLTRLIQLLYLFIADVPQLQPFTGRAKQRLGALRNIGELRIAEIFIAALSYQVFLLGGDHGGAIDREQWLAFLHELADVVDEDLIDK